MKPSSRKGSQIPRLRGKTREADLYSSFQGDEPDGEAFVIYTGREKAEKEGQT